MPVSLLGHLPRVGALPRRLLAGACLLLAALTAVSAHRQANAAGPTRTVLVAARPLPVGHHLVRSDLLTRRFPAGLAPVGTATEARALVGRTLAAPVARGEPLGLARTVGRELADGLGPGTVATVVVLAGRHAADLIRPGDRVDLLAAPAAPDGGSVADTGSANSAGSVGPIAAAVRVLAVLPADPDAATSGVTDGSGPQLVVGTTETVAIRLTRASSTHIFTAFVRAP